MKFLREMLQMAIGVAILGAIVAFTAKVTGVEKSFILAGVTGGVAGWGACWFYNAWTQSVKDGSKKLPIDTVPQSNDFDRGIRRPVDLPSTSPEIDRKTP